MATTGNQYIAVPGAERGSKHDATAFKVGVYSYERVDLQTSAVGSTTGSTMYPSHTIGDKIILGERVFYYGRTANAANAIPGELYQSALSGTSLANNCNNCAVYANATAGSYQFQLIAQVAYTIPNYFFGGYMNIVIPSAANLQTTIRIAATSNTTLIGANNVMTVTLFDPLPFTLTTGANVSLTQSIWDRPVTMNATLPTGVPCGVPLVTIPGSNNTANAANYDYYGWFQTWGPCAILTNAVGVMGFGLGPGAQNGTVANVSNALQPILGWTMRIQGANNWAMAYLQIAP
jgi:hypothetical protein